MLNGTIRCCAPVVDTGWEDWLIPESLVAMRQGRQRGQVFSTSKSLWWKHGEGGVGAVLCLHPILVRVHPVDVHPSILGLASPGLGLADVNNLLPGDSIRLTPRLAKPNKSKYILIRAAGLRLQRRDYT